MSGSYPIPPERPATSPADPATVQDRMQRNQGLVHALAWQIWHKLGKRVDREDLVAYGNVGLAEAAQRYDPQQGEFSTYAWRRVRGAIYDGLAELTWFDAAAFHANRYETLAREVLAGDETTRAASEGGASDDASWLVDTAGRLAVAHLICTDAENRAMQVADESEDSPGRHAELVEERAILGEALERLPRQDRELIRSVYFEGQSLTEAGRRAGMSKATASRRHSEILRILLLAFQRPLVSAAARSMV